MSKIGLSFKHFNGCSYMAIMLFGKNSWLLEFSTKKPISFAGIKNILSVNFGELMLKTVIAKIANKKVINLNI